MPRMLGLEGRLTAEATESGTTRIIPERLDLGPGRLEVVSMGLLVDDEDRPR